LQVLGSQEWVDLAVENYTKNLSSPAPRGIIYDRNGYILARNVASYNLTITPANLPDDEADIQRIYRAVSELTGIPVNRGTLDEAKLFGACVEGPGISQLVELGDSLAPYSAVPIKCNVGEDVARAVEERGVDWPGVDIEVNPIALSNRLSTANLLGYLGPIPALLEEVRAGLSPSGRQLRRGRLSLVLTGRNGSAVVQVTLREELRNLSRRRECPAST
jgi:penicillin-binding protein 2